MWYFLLLAIIPLLLFLYIIYFLVTLTIMTKKWILYPLPPPDRALVHKNIVYKQEGNLTLHCDIYTPQERGKKLPCVILLQGDTPDFIMKNAKDWNIFVSYGRLLAAAGCTAIAFNRRSANNEAKYREAEGDLADIIGFVEKNGDTYCIDKSRIALWTFSSGALLGVSWALRQPREFIKGVISCYGLLAGKNANYSPVDLLKQTKSSDASFLVVKAEKDMKKIKESNETFYDLAKAKGFSIEILRHPEGKHAFDVLNNNDKTREMIGKMIEFVKRCVIKDQ